MPDRTVIVRTVIIAVGVFIAFFGSDLSLTNESGYKDAVVSAADAIVAATVALAIQLLHQHVPTAETPSPTLYDKDTP